LIIGFYDISNNFLRTGKTDKLLSAKKHFLKSSSNPNKRKQTSIQKPICFYMLKVVLELKISKTYETTT